MGRNCSRVRVGSYLTAMELSPATTLLPFGLRLGFGRAPRLPCPRARRRLQTDHARETEFEARATYQDAQYQKRLMF